MNEWPGGKRHAMSQSAHSEWNSTHFPGTRQLCSICDQPTGRCEDDTLSIGDDGEPLCEECWREHGDSGEDEKPYLGETDRWADPGEHCDGDSAETGGE